MKKIKLIIQREYITRVRKKSFIIMTFLGPILMAAMFVVPIWVAGIEDGENKLIAVFDESNSFDGKISPTESLKFEFNVSESPQELKENLDKSGYYGMLLIPANPKEDVVQFFSEKKPGIAVKSHIENELEREIEIRNLQALGLSKIQMDSVKTSVQIETFVIQEDGKTEENFTELNMIIGFIGAFAVYMFIFLYGSQVMRGVIDEKTNRIVEVLISSVTPFELMMGKIVGIAGVAFTQFLLWIVLTMGLVTAAQSFVFKDTKVAQETLNQSLVQQGGGTIDMNDLSGAEKIFGAFRSQKWGVLISVFLFFFLGGYLLYAALFAAAGSAVDNETETQQFVLPLSLPLILSIVMAQGIIQNPDGAMSFWFSIIPFTSPVIMLIRVAFDSYEAWELALSMTLLVLTFIGTTWFAGKIYRVGILMYGKKVNYKELWKWIKYKN